MIRLSVDTLKIELSVFKVFVFFIEWWKFFILWTAVPVLC